MRRSLAHLLLLLALFGIGIVGVEMGSLTDAHVAFSANAEQLLKPGDKFTDCLGCPQMMVVPAGPFMMGSPTDEPSYNYTESPQHLVTFAQPFAVGRFSVTVDQWYLCVDAGACSDWRPSPPQVYGVAAFGRGSMPAINMSWNDAKAYVAWLSRVTGKRYRLPTEAEREYVTRAGTTTAFWWGSSLTTLQANFDGTQPYNGGAPGESRMKTVPVETFTPNPWGLYQVHGNVYDLVEDCLHDTYDGAPADGSAWATPNCTQHVMRGGSWESAGNFLRSASRQGDGPWSPAQGIRVARTLTP
jgi:formylglycine-generating enzyme required for sulfatase activity